MKIVSNGSLIVEIGFYKKYYMCIDPYDILDLSIKAKLTFP